MTKRSLDHPFDLILAEARKKIHEGADVYQKYTCSGCGARLGMEEANTFYAYGTCDKCPAVTDIRAAGCNYVLLMPGRSPQRQLIVKEPEEDIYQ